MQHDTKLIVQARSGSTRLSKKILLPFFDTQTILDIILHSLSEKFGSNNVIVATTENSEDDEILKIASKYSCCVFRGNEFNVLDRFINAAHFYKVKNIIRICADNPFLNIKYLEELIFFHEKNNYDYVSYEIALNMPTIKSHIGLFAEATTLSALERVQSLTSDSLFLEHVTNYLYGNSNLFNNHLIRLPEKIYNQLNIRLTIDTLEDFTLLQKLYKTYKSDKIGSDVNKFIDMIKGDKDLIQKMKSQIQRNEK